MARSSDLAILVHLTSDEQLNLNKRMRTPLRKSSCRSVDLFKRRNSALLVRGNVFKADHRGGTGNDLILTVE